MSSNSTSSNSNSTVSNSIVSGMSFKMKSISTNTIGIWIFGLVSVSMFIGSFVNMSKFVGSKDDWNLIQPQITKILILTLIGTFGLIITTLLYFIQDSSKTIYFILVLSCLTLGLSFSSLAIAAISR